MLRVLKAIAFFLWFVACAIGTVLFLQVAIWPDESFAPCPLWMRIVSGIFGTCGVISLLMFFKFPKEMKEEANG
jgi:hypothetical protein